MTAVQPATGTTVPVSGLPGGIAPAGVVEGFADLLARWRAVENVAGCTNPVRLVGQVVVEDAAGRLRVTYSTADEPGGVLLVPCGNRRESVCPSCAHLYRYDTYQLVAAGLRGGLNLVPETVAEHPQAFITLTAPSFGLVHGVRKTRTGTGPDGPVYRYAPCRPRRARGRSLCPHGRALWCQQRHTDHEAVVGTPLCGECYDYTGAVLWNYHAPMLWRRFQTYLLRELAASYGLSQNAVKGLVRGRFVKVGEYQRRGLIHLHGVIRLDAPDLDTHRPPLLHVPYPKLAAAVQRAAERVEVVTPELPGRLAWPPAELLAHPERADMPAVRVLRFGPEIDVQPIRPADLDPGRLGGGEVGKTVVQVAGYLGKYVTKSLDVPGLPASRIRSRDQLDAVGCRTHYRNMIRTAWELGGLKCASCHGAGILDQLTGINHAAVAAIRKHKPRPTLDDAAADDAPPVEARAAPCTRCATGDRSTGRMFPTLRQWAHMLGFGGHIVTKSRRYSTTYSERRQRRRDYQRARRLGLHVEDLADQDDQAATVTHRQFVYSGRGYRHLADYALADLAADLARSRRTPRIADTNQPDQERSDITTDD